MMTKQTIEIDVPEGWRFDSTHTTIFDNEPDVLVFLKKKEPEFIEVREYLHNGSNDYVLHNSIQKDLHQKASEIESLPGFIRWLDNDWRKIYI